MQLLPAFVGAPAINTIHNMDAMTLLKHMPSQSVNCIVTSPPYFGLRDYGMAGQIGLEETPQQFVAKLVELFREARRVLRDDGTFWLNLGDSYAGNNSSSGEGETRYTSTLNGGAGVKPHEKVHAQRRVTTETGIPSKNLIGIPWRVAFGLQDDGWILRSDIIWHKPNPMPESVTDRPTKAHEYVFLFAKSQRYFYDAEAIWEVAAYDGRHDERQKGSAKYTTHTVPGQSTQSFASTGHERWRFNADGVRIRNKHSVWKVSTEPFSGAHFATFPTKLIEPMILAGCPVGGVVYDPFIGSGTTALVARKHGRDYIGSELNPEYTKIARDRLAAPYTPSFMPQLESA